jgi:GNAT superfamily N-acetyltransferase
LRFVDVCQDDELAQPLFAELAVEYSTRYDDTEEGVLRWLRGHPAADFAPPHGGMLIGLLDGQPVTGGAFCRFGAGGGSDTAELKRIWTDQRYRRRGYGRVLLTELEDRIASQGYRRTYLITGTRQPEAEALYIAAGYTRLAQPREPEPDFTALAFEKVLFP